MSSSDHSTKSSQNSSSGSWDSAKRDSLPCLYRINSTENHEQNLIEPLALLGSQQKTAIQKMSTQHKKTASNLSFAVYELARRFGIDNIGFQTFTFEDNVTDPKEAQRRFNSLSTHVLKKRYREHIRVYERQKRGAVHYHLLIVLDHDIRTGFDFEAISKRDYSSANSYLKKEWSFWRKTAKKYGFGRVETLPVKSTSSAIARYVGKYISKGVEARQPEDKGVRLVSYSKGAKIGSTNFTFISEGSRQWRAKMAVFAELVARHHGKFIVEYEDFQIIFGKKWCYHFSDLIISLPEKIEDLKGDEFANYLLEKEYLTFEDNRQRNELKSLIENSSLDNKKNLMKTIDNKNYLMPEIKDI